MSAAEILHRGYAVGRDILLRGSQSRKDWTPARSADFNALLTPGPLHCKSEYLATADAIITGRLQLFQAFEIDYRGSNKWNTDPLSGVVAPSRYALGIDYRSERVAGNIKFLWEPNRHLHLVTLAQAWSINADQKYLNALIAEIDSWLDACPYLIGVNWTSSLELGIRLINWALIWNIVDAVDDRETATIFQTTFRERWLESIRQHLHILKWRKSRHSSANNHLIGELAGYFVAASSWMFDDISEDDRRQAWEELLSEAERQTSPDGVNLEQTLAYQHFVLDFLLISRLLGAAQGYDCSRLDAIITRMLSFLAACMDSAGQVPMIGDDDEGFVMRLSREPNFNHFRSLLATGAVLYENRGFAQKAKTLDDKSLSLLGAESASLFERLLSNAPAESHVHDFREGGYVVMGSNFGAADELRCTVDVGPLGYLAIAAHGHADALAVHASFAGVDMLMDPGTYSYHTDKLWRDHFRSTVAHNTVCVDHEDQSVILGNFMWGERANVTLNELENLADGARLSAEHDGYQRLDNPVQHHRHIEVKGCELRVSDTLDGTGNNHFAVHWQLHENATAEIDHNNQTINVTCGEVTMTLEYAADGIDLTADVVSGQDEPPLGWVSRAFHHKTPAPTIRIQGHIGSGETITSRFVFARHVAPDQETKNR